jgi:hypothetical protein
LSGCKRQAGMPVLLNAIGQIILFQSLTFTFLSSLARFVYLLRAWNKIIRSERHKAAAGANRRLVVTFEMRTPGHARVTLT